MHWGNYFLGEAVLASACILLVIGLGVLYTNRPIQQAGPTKGTMDATKASMVKPTFTAVDLLLRLSAVFYIH